MPRPRSKTTVSSKKSDCEDLQHTLKKEPEDLRLRITELEAKLDQCVKKISQREQERDKALDDLAIVQARVSIEQAVEALVHLYSKLLVHDHVYM